LEKKVDGEDGGDVVESFDRRGTKGASHVSECDVLCAL
jgi:hypothetical protein